MHQRETLQLRERESWSRITIHDSDMEQSGEQRCTESSPLKEKRLSHSWATWTWICGAVDETSDYPSAFIPSSLRPRFGTGKRAHLGELKGRAGSEQTCLTSDFSQKPHLRQFANHWDGHSM